MEDNQNNLPDWVVSIWKKREANPAEKKKTIEKVPQILRKVTSNEACFNPEVLSLGPYHHGNEKPHLKRLEKYKHMAVWSYTNSNDDLTKAESFYNAVRGVVDQVRTCYEENNEISDDKFAWMMLMDGCFVLEFMTDLLFKKNKLSLSEHDKSLVVTDMMRLENQLPFLVLKTLTVSKEKGEAAGKEKLLTIINQFTDHLIQTPWLSSGKNGEKISSARGGDVNEEDEDSVGDNNDPEHLLDSFRTKLLGKKSTQQVQQTEEGDSEGDEDADDEREPLLDSPPSQKEDKQPGDRWYTFRSASELKAAGIKFSKSSSKLSDVRFESGYFSGELFLPPILVDDSTKGNFLNMIAYELCPDGPRDYGISTYICFMDSLIDSVEDVKILRSADIVSNKLGSDKQLAHLFNVLATDLIQSEQYEQVMKKIQSHCKGSWNVHMATLYYTQFHSPWAVLGTIAAFFLLSLTVIQTYFAFYPSSN
ncbi:UPF0481 protein At3g47200-like [Tasmannia lanceolata]|uniref:UPF0481 protein At3g47200-like n=1 Tax=Tasmannia lanceolata TaxID=3420 RepID=UPI0040628FDD